MVKNSSQPAQPATNPLKNKTQAFQGLGLLPGCEKWMGWQGSNLRMTESKSVGLPLADTPASSNENHFFRKKRRNNQEISEFCQKNAVCQSRLWVTRHLCRSRCRSDLSGIDALPVKRAGLVSALGQPDFSLRYRRYHHRWCVLD